MTAYPVHTLSSAPEKSRPLMQAAADRMGFLPNLLGVMAGSPAVIDSYLTMGGKLAQTSFSAAEQQLLQLSISAANGCEYCVAAHTVGGKRSGLPDAVVEAVRKNQPIKDAKMEGLRRFAQAVVEKRGWVDRDDQASFVRAGFTAAQALEVVVAVAMKTLSNYVNHMADTPVDTQFLPAKWTKLKAG